MSLTLTEAIAAANEANPDIEVKTTTLIDPPTAPDDTVVIVEYRAPDGQLYAAWHTIETPARLIARLTEQARSYARPMDAPVGA